MAKALSPLDKNIRRFYKLNVQRKALEKEEAALKAFFKGKAAGVEQRFVDEKAGLEVVFSNSPVVRVDLDKLRIELGPKISDYETSSMVERVVVKEFKAVKAKRSAA